MSLKNKKTHPIANQIQETSNKPLKEIIPFIIISFYLAVHFISNWGAIDVLGPQWLFISIADAFLLLYIALNKAKYEKYLREVFKLSFSRLYLGLFILAGISIFYSINKVEAWVCYSRFISTIIAFFNVVILLQSNIKTFFLLTCRLLAIVLLAESLLYFNSFFNQINNVRLDELIYLLNGNTGNKNILGASLAIKIPFVLYAIHTSKFTTRIFFSLCLFLGALTIFMASARAAYVSLAITLLAYVGFIIVNFIQDKEIKKYIPKITYVLLPIILAVFISIYIFDQVVLLQETRYTSEYGNVRARFSSLTDTKSAAGYRFMLWKHAFDYIGANPLIGAGYGNWKLASIPFEKEFIDDLNVPAHAHNDFLEYFTELGIPGGILFLSLFVCAFLYTRNILKYTKDKSLKEIIFFSFIGIITYSVDSALNFPIERPIMQVFFIMTFAFVIATYIVARMDVANVHTANTSTKPAFTLTSVYSLCFSIILAPAIYTNNSTYESLKAQMRVIPDMKNEPMSIPLAEVKTMFPPIPNLTSSSQPIEAILGRYYSENKQYDDALRLLRKSIPHNPYIYYSQFLMANVFFNTNQMDSAKFYAELAYYNKPRANTYYQTLVAVHAKRRDTAGVAKAFRTYTKYRNEPFAWNLYLMGMLNAQQRATTELLKLSDSALTLFDPKGNTPASEADYANLLKRKQEIISNLNFAGTVGNSAEQNAATLQKATQIYNEGVAAFAKQDYQTAAAKFVRAAEINAFNYAIYENAGVSYFNLKQYRRAIYYFDKVIALKITNDGKSEFFKGVSHINLGEKEVGCQTLQISKSKNYADANNIIVQYCK